LDLIIGELITALKEFVLLANFDRRLHYYGCFLLGSLFLLLDRLSRDERRTGIRVEA